MFLEETEDSQREVDTAEGKQHGKVRMAAQEEEGDGARKKERPGGELELPAKHVTDGEDPGS